MRPAVSMIQGVTAGSCLAMCLHATLAVVLLHRSLWVTNLNRSLLWSPYLQFVLGQGCGSTYQVKRGPYCHHQGPIFPSTAEASSVSKRLLFLSIIIFFRNRIICKSSELKNCTWFSLSFGPNEVKVSFKSSIALLAISSEPWRTT